MSWDDARARHLLRAAFDAAVAAADPRRVLAAHLPERPRGRCVVVGAGKSAAMMAAALEDAWPDVPLTGVVVTRYGHGVPTRRIRVVESSHPVPDANGEAAARDILAAVQGLGAGDLVVALMSGGASALMPLPAPGLTLADKQAVNRALLASGATIHEMNCVRKHLSAIKGGRLAAAAAPARVVTLAISDVPGDDPAVIGSGPTVPDPTTFADARAILARYGITPPPSVAAHLAAAAEETPKPGSLPHAHFTPDRDPADGAGGGGRGGAAGGAHAAHSRRRAGGREPGDGHRASRHRPCGAHPRDPARRRRQCCSRAARPRSRSAAAPPGAAGATRSSCSASRSRWTARPASGRSAGDTDGIDGVEDAAGAIVAPDTLARARAQGLDARALLAGHDSFALFVALGDLIVTGPTLTNVNDFRAILIA